MAACGRNGRGGGRPRRKSLGVAEGLQKKWNCCGQEEIGNRCSLGRVSRGGFSPKNGHPVDLSDCIFAGAGRERSCSSPLQVARRPTG